MKLAENLSDTENEALVRVARLTKVATGSLKPCLLALFQDDLEIDIGRFEEALERHRQEEERSARRHRRRMLKYRLWGWIVGRKPVRIPPKPIYMRPYSSLLFNESLAPEQRKGLADAIFQTCLEMGRDGPYFRLVKIDGGLVITPLPGLTALIPVQKPELDLTALDQQL